MLRPDIGSLPARAPVRDRGPGMLAIGISLGLHGAAVACFVFFGEVKPPELYAVFAVELVGAADVMANPREDAGKQSLLSHAMERASAEAAGSTPDMGRLADNGTPDERSAAFEAPRKNDEFPVEQTAEPTPVSGRALSPGTTPDGHETDPPDPAEPPRAAGNAPAPQVSTEAALWVPPAPRRKPLPPNPSPGPELAERRIEAKLARIKHGPLRLAVQESAREVARLDADRAAARMQQSAKFDVGKDHGVAAVPATVRSGGLVDTLGDGPGVLPRYAGGGLSNAPPRYPYLARRRGQEGRVVLRVQVTAGGNPAAVRVRQSSGFRLLDDAAIAAVKAWRFAPANRGGIPVAGSVDVPVSYKLTDW